MKQNSTGFLLRERMKATMETVMSMRKRKTPVYRTLMEKISRTPTLLTDTEDNNYEGVPIVIALAGPAPNNNEQEDDKTDTDRYRR